MELLDARSIEVSTVKTDRGMRVRLNIPGVVDAHITPETAFRFGGFLLKGAAAGFEGLEGDHRFADGDAAHLATTIDLGSKALAEVLRKLNEMEGGEPAA